MVCRVGQGTVGAWSRATVGAIKPDLRISILKPLHARWLMEAIAKVRSDVIVNGFEKSGIKESIVY